MNRAGFLRIGHSARRGRPTFFVSEVPSAASPNTSFDVLAPATAQRDSAQLQQGTNDVAIAGIGVRREGNDLQVIGQSEINESVKCYSEDVRCSERPYACHPLEDEIPQNSVFFINENEIVPVCLLS